jgi:hypothetical protein
VKHRNIDYDAEQIALANGAGKYIPKWKLDQKTSEATFGSRDAAIAARIIEINNGLDMKSNTPRVPKKERTDVISCASRSGTKAYSRLSISPTRGERQWSRRVKRFVSRRKGRSTLLQEAATVIASPT